MKRLSPPGHVEAGRQPDPVSNAGASSAVIIQRAESGGASKSPVLWLPAGKVNNRLVDLSTGRNLAADLQLARRPRPQPMPLRTMAPSGYGCRPLKGRIDNAFRIAGMPDMHDYDSVQAAVVHRRTPTRTTRGPIHIAVRIPCCTLAR